MRQTKAKRVHRRQRKGNKESEKEGNTSLKDLPEIRLVFWLLGNRNPFFFFPQSCLIHWMNVALKQNKTKQNKTKQNKTKQNKTKQNKTIQRYTILIDGSVKLLELVLTHSVRRHIVPHPP